MAIFAVACLILSLAIAAVNWRRGEDARSSLRSYSALALLLVGVWVMLLGSIIVNPRGTTAKSTHCLSNTKQLALSAIMYAGDSDDRMPISNLRPSLKPYLKPILWACPSQPDKVGYGFNGYLNGASFAEVSNPEDHLLVSEADRTAEWIKRDRDIVFGHGPRVMVGFVDGHAKRASVSTKAQWTDKKAADFTLAKGSDYKPPLPWATYRQGPAMFLLLGGVVSGLTASAFHRDPIRTKFWRVAFYSWVLSLIVLILLFPMM